jgi:hypothetical protein
MIDINKKYQTRDGREVRIYATDGNKGEEIHGAFKNLNGKWCSSMWEYNGRNAYKCSEADLIEVRPRHKRMVWLNVYGRPDDVTAYIDKWKADQSVSPRIACIKVELNFEEGEGL